MAGVALLLLMACANVAGLLLARSAARSREMVYSTGIGGELCRIVRQLLTEGLLLSVHGGLAGILLTGACLPLLAARSASDSRSESGSPAARGTHRHRSSRAGVRDRGHGSTAILFALSPALRCARADVTSTLKGGRTTTRRLVAGNLIVMAQVGICTVLLMGAFLLVETLDRMRSMNPGFDADRVVTFTIDPSMRGYTPDQSRTFSNALLQKAGAVPGVSAASIASLGLMRGTGMKATFGVVGSRISPNDFLNSSANQVTPGYFATMGMDLLAGRTFNWFDRATSEAASRDRKPGVRTALFPRQDSDRGKVRFSRLRRRGAGR